MVLKLQNMPSQPRIARSSHLSSALASLLAAALTCCDSPAPNAEKSPLPAESTLHVQLAGARIDSAKSKLEQHQPGEALSLSISALLADTSSTEALALAEKILTETRWNLPEISLPHPSQIDHITFAEPASLWISFGGETNACVRWNLETASIESVLFPENKCVTRSLIFDPTHRAVIVQRHGVMLLCDAQTLKPRAALPALPASFTPASVVVFSDDGLLFAHPTSAPENDGKILWQVRDTASGELIRASESAIGADTPPALAASLTRQKLRIIHADGSLTEMPISPIEPIETTQLPQATTLLQAQFSSAGDAVLALIDSGPHQAPQRSIISYGDSEDNSLELDALARRFPWSRHPCLWSGLLSGPELAPFIVDQSTLSFPNSTLAPIELSAEISAVATGQNRVITGEITGLVTLHRLLPLPEKKSPKRPAKRPGNKDLVSLDHLACALSGVRYDEKLRNFTRIDHSERAFALAACDLAAIHEIFPNLDFSKIPALFETPRELSPTANQVLTSRLAAADPKNPAALEEASKIEAIFAKNDLSSLTAALKSTDGTGPAIATALALALTSDQPESIQACLEISKNLPPLLRKISLSRIAWLQNRKADALSVWPELIPDLSETRKHEDWLGWEQADFAPALQTIRQAVNDELAAIEVPENSSPEQRAAIASRLIDPQTLAAVGRSRFADACLKAALAFSSHRSETQTTLQLAEIARNLGAPPEPCLRAEALALTALGAYEKAHPRWITLITEHPVETHLPADYAEAAYTAFENADPRQAMEILTTGLHRFPDDANFALRAGWVALLTGNPERAYQFLLTGQRIGYPQEKRENATALLTIAAEQVGANDDATVYFRDLLAIDPAWANAKILDTLEWPEELKWTLRQFMH